MNKKVARILLIALVIVGLSSLGLAQKTTQTGTLVGTVIDDQGTPLPGVTVTASSPSLMLPQVSMLTDEKGFFRLPQLPTGIYKVVFNLAGFKTIVREGIKISLGVTITLNMTMEPSTIEETVVVVGEAPTVDMKKTSLGTNIDHDFLVNIPIERRYVDVFAMAPGVIWSDDNRPISHGSHQTDNDYNLDGVLVGEPGSGTMASVQIGYEIAEEFTIESAGLTAEYGNVKGSMLNLITKSGGNKLSGEVNFYYRDKKLQSDNTEGTPFEGKFVGTNYDYDGSFSLGGPIIRDKVWFFAHYSQQYVETFVEGFPYDKDEHVPADYKKQYPYVKLSWQINPAMKFVGSWNMWKGDRHNRNADYRRNEDTTWEGDFRSFTFNLAYSYMISKNFIATAKVAAVDIYTYYYPMNDLPSYYDYATRQYTGSMGRQYIADKKRYQAITDATYFVDDFYGRHEFKTGFEYIFEQVDGGYNYNKDPRNGVGYLIYTRNNGRPYRAYDYVDYLSTSQYSFFGFYIQDRWNPMDRLTFNLGIRYDHQEDIIPKQGEDREYEPARVLETFKPVVVNIISPRFGVSYDLTGDGKTVIKASYGRYQKSYYSGRYSNPNGYEQRRYYLNSDWSLGRMYYFSASAATSVDPDIKASYLDEILIGIERELFPDISLSINYIRKWDKNLHENVIVEALDIEAIKKGEYIWSHYTPVTTVDPFNGNTVTFYERDASIVTQTALITNPEPSKRYYSGLEITLKKRFSHNWQLMASYNYSKSTGLVGLSRGSHAQSSYFNDPNAHINALGRFANERRHQFKVHGTYQAPFGIVISTFYKALAGRRYTRYIRSGDLGLSLNQGNVSILAEEKGSSGLPWLHIWDVRVEKRFRIKRFSLGLIADAFNVLNLNTTTSVETLSSSPSVEFEKILGIMDPRILRLGIRISWN